MTSVPLLDLKAQYATLRDEIRAAIDAVVESQHFIMGPVVTALEQDLAVYCGVRHVVGVSSGTDALLVALMAYDIGPGDEVVTTPYSFFATGGVIARLGARPVYVDIDPATFNIDAEQAAAAITDRTRALIPVHLFGRVVELDSLLAAAQQRSIPVIEDAAQAIGAFDTARRQAGSVGQIGCFSFFPSKNLGAFGDAGMCTTNSDDLGERLALLRVHGGKPKYYHSIVGGNFRLDALQAAVLRVKLKYLDQWTAARRSNASRYRTLFEQANLLETVTLPSDVPGHIYNQFVVRAPRRNDLQAFLSGKKIGSEVYYPVPLHLQACFAGLGYKPGSLPHSEQAARETLALPIYPELTAAQQEYVVHAIRVFYQQ